jgi:hypothetical protein
MECNIKRLECFFFESKSASPFSILFASLFTFTKNRYENVGVSVFALLAAPAWLGWMISFHHG